MDQNPEIPLKETPEKTTEKREMEQGEASSTNAKPMAAQVTDVEKPSSNELAPTPTLPILPLIAPPSPGLPAPMPPPSSLCDPKILVRSPQDPNEFVSLMFPQQPPVRTPPVQSPPPRMPTVPLQMPPPTCLHDPNILVWYGFKFVLLPPLSPSQEVPPPLLPKQDSPPLQEDPPPPPPKKDSPLLQEDPESKSQNQSLLIPEDQFLAKPKPKPKPNPNPNFRNQDLSLPSIPKSQTAMARRSRSEDGKYVIVFGGYNGSKEEPTLMKGGVPHTTIEWYSIPVPDAESESNYSALKLTPFSVGELHKVNRFESLKSSIYCLSGCSDEMWILNSTNDCWNCGPNMIVSRRNPHTLVLDGKLFVLGGLGYPPHHSCHWMEVFDPGHGPRGRWEALPNPPAPIYPYLMFSAAFEDTKEIIVSSVQQPKSKNDQYRTCVLYSYDVRAGSWTKLMSPPFKLQGGGPDPTFNRAVVAANKLHWVWFDNKVELVLQAYHLPTNAWFEGRLKFVGIVLGNDESLSDMDPPALIHLSHLSGRKFCVPIQSYYFPKKGRKKKKKKIPFLCLVIFEVSEDDKQVKQDYRILNISFVSVQKYRLDHSLRFSNAVLLDGAFNASMQKKPKLCAN